MMLTKGGDLHGRRRTQEPRGGSRKTRLRRKWGSDSKFAARMTSASGRTFLMKHASLDTHPPEMDIGPLKERPAPVVVME